MRGKESEHGVGRRQLAMSAHTDRLRNQVSEAWRIEQLVSATKRVAFRITILLSLFICSTVRFDKSQTLRSMHAKDCGKMERKKLPSLSLFFPQYSTSPLRSLKATGYKPGIPT